MVFRIISVVCLTILAGACTNKSVYDGIQQNRLAECNKEPNESARTECIGDLDPNYESYESYKRERETLIRRSER